MSDVSQGSSIPRPCGAMICCDGPPTPRTGPASPGDTQSTPVILSHIKRTCMLLTYIRQAEN